jgi:hypothetical protein
MSNGQKGFTPVLEKVAAAVERAAKSFERATLEDELIGGRYAIKSVGAHYEVWDAETHDVYGPYRTYDDAKQAVRRL